MINEEFTSYKKLHDELCFVGCLKKIKVLIGNHFFRYFNENLGGHIFSFWVIYPWNLPYFFET